MDWCCRYTARSGFVNLHLLVNPVDPNHVDEIRRFLSRLHFAAHDDTYGCTSADLIRLGKAADPSKDSKKALADVFWVLLNSSEFILNH